MSQTDREQAEAHWMYTEKVILKMLELSKQLYKDAFIHGVKHGREE